MINKKKNLLLLIGGIILILLLGIYIFVNAYSKHKVAKETEASIEETILSFNAEDIKSISISQDENEFSLTKEDSTWLSKEKPDLPILSTKVENLLSQVEELKYNKKITDVENVEQYGLADNKKITVTFGDEKDQTYSISFGELNLSTKDCYVYLNDKTTVYTIDGSIRSAYDITLYDLIDSDIYPNISSTNIQSVSINADEQTLVVTSNQDNRTTYGVTLNDKPQREAASDKVNELYQTLTSISFDKCIDYNPESPGVYGLGAHSMVVSINYIDENTESTSQSDVDVTRDTVQETSVETTVDTDRKTSVDSTVDTAKETSVESTVDTAKETSVENTVDTAIQKNDETVVDPELESQTESQVPAEDQTDTNMKTLTFRIGDYTEKEGSTGKFYYVQLEGSLQIQLVSESSLTSLLDISLSKLLNPVFTPMNQSEMDYTLVTYEGQEYKLYSSKSTIMGSESKADSSQDSSSTADKYYLNDTEVNADLYQDFITSAMTMKAESFLADNTKTVTNPVLNITYVAANGAQYPVWYYEYDSNYYLVKTDAGICLINKLNLSSLITKLQALLPSPVASES